MGISGITGRQTSHVKFCVQVGVVLVGMGPIRPLAKNVVAVVVPLAVEANVVHVDGKVGAATLFVVKIAVGKPSRYLIGISS